MPTTLTWRRIAAVLSAINVVAFGFAAGALEPLHAAVHAVLAVAFGVAAVRLRSRVRSAADGATLDALELELERLRRALGETQERMDFTERLLAREDESRRLAAERRPPDPPAPG